jgi:hypothetical protein
MARNAWTIKADDERKILAAEKAAPYNQLGVWGSAVSSPSDRVRAEPGRQTVLLHLWS